jgi:hypothetical protein
MQNAARRLTLVVDRKDAPELLEMEREGLVVSRFIVYDEQPRRAAF